MTRVRCTSLFIVDSGEPGVVFEQEQHWFKGIGSHDYGERQVQTCNVGLAGRKPGERMVQVNFESSLLKNSFLLRTKTTVSFILFIPSTD